VRVDVRAPSRSAMFRYGQHVSAMGRVFTRHDPLVSKSGRLSRVIHVLFKTAAELLLDLGAQESARGLGRRLNYYATRGLFVIDEIGYLSYDARAADLLFQVVSRRYERRSLVLTTNLPFSEWPSIFPNAATATALIDRVVHHAEIITIEGESYRRRVAEAQQKSARAIASH